MFNPFTKKQRQKNFILELWNEMNVNLERFYVISQRQFIASAFNLDAWEEAVAFSGFVFPQEVHKYAEVLADFNCAFVEVRTFEEFYSSSIDNKTRVNAELLHARQERLEEKVTAIQDSILGAQKIVRSMLDKK